MRAKDKKANLNKVQITNVPFNGPIGEGPNIVLYILPPGPVMEDTIVLEFFKKWPRKSVRYRNCFYGDNAKGASVGMARIAICACENNMSLYYISGLYAEGENRKILPSFRYDGLKNVLVLLSTLLGKSQPTVLIDRENFGPRDAAWQQLEAMLNLTLAANGVKVIVHGGVGEES